jgi:hypothetical protein
MIKVIANFFSLDPTEAERLITLLSPVELGEQVEECMDGTREDVLERVYDWLDDLDAPNILWVSGGPGAGKSTILSTVSARLMKGPRLASKFFFQRDDGRRTNPFAFWRTVAFQLARFDHSVKATLATILKQEMVDLATTRLETLFRNIIQMPLMRNEVSLSMKRPVIILDALDECGGGEVNRLAQRQSLLKTLISWSQLSRSFKILVASRGEDDITKSLQEISQRVHLYTGPQVNSETSRGIRRFFEMSFADIARRYPDSLPQPWPEPAVVEQLTEHAAGLFVWAKAIMTLVKQDHPSRQLSLILDGQLGNVADIDALYRNILTRAFKEPTPDIVASFKAVVGAVVFSKEPLSRSDLQHFLGDDVCIDYILSALHSVISMEEQDATFRIIHQSFVDFVVDSEWCPEPFLIIEAEQHQHLALACLRVMKEELRFNICDLETSYHFNDDVPDMTERVAAAIPSHLSYSCCYWYSHLQVASYTDSLLTSVQDFIPTRVLYWLEVLSLIQEVSIASPALRFTTNWSKVCII